MSNLKHIVNFFFELAQLRFIKRSGWRMLKIESPESVAEHNIRAAQIAYILALMEKYHNPYLVCTLSVFHELEECRIGDIDKLTNRYVKRDAERVVLEQTKNLGGFGKNLFSLWSETEEQKTKAGIISKDADWLECGLVAKEYLEKGNEYAQDWLNNIAKALKTKSANKLYLELLKTNSNEWWQGLKKLDHS